MTFKVGDKVILGKHIDPATGEVHNWNPDMEKYVGKVATVQEVGIFTGQRPYHYIKVDLSPRWYWESLYQKLASRDPLNDGCRCSKCGEWVPYVEPSDSFVCYSCKRRP